MSLILSIKRIMIKLGRHIFAFFLLLAGFMISGLQAQELNCRVNVNAQQVQSSDPQKFQELQKTINEFMNNRQWTNQKFKVEERIECSVFINIQSEPTTDKYKANIQVQSRRPVYNTSYNTTILNYKDNSFTFEYTKYQSLNFDINTFQSNLTSVLAYYAYLIIGLDFDTFSPMGGGPYLQKAQNIVSNAQNSDAKGWKSFESKKNRYWLVEDLLNSNIKALRQGMYVYHRKGLDQMAEEMNKGRQEVLKALEKIKQAKRQKSFLHILDVLMDAKKDELINIFKKAAPMEKTKAVNLLKEINPANSGEYEKIMKNE